MGTESRSDKCVPSSEKIFSTFVPRWFLPHRPKNRRKSRQAPPEDAANWQIFWPVIPLCNGPGVTLVILKTACMYALDCNCHCFVGFSNTARNCCKTVAKLQSTLNNFLQAYSVSHDSNNWINITKHSITGIQIGVKKIENFKRCQGISIVRQIFCQCQQGVFKPLSHMQVCLKPPNWHWDHTQISPGTRKWYVF